MLITANAYHVILASAGSGNDFLNGTFRRKLVIESLSQPTLKWMKQKQTTLNQN